MTALTEGSHHLFDVDVHAILGQRAMVIEDFHELSLGAMTVIAFSSPIRRRKPIGDVRRFPELTMGGFL
jgi:hypothetical protein